VFVTVVSRADVRIGVAGATVGFAGPRVVTAVTGQPLPEGAHRAESALAAGLLDAVLPGPDVPGWLRRALDVLMAEPSGPPAEQVAHPPAPAPDRTGWEQVVAARSPRRIGAAAWLAGVLDPAAVELGSADPAVGCWLGRCAAGGRPLVAVALGTTPGRRPGPAGFALLTRAAGLAGRLGLALLTVVDTAGADPGPAAEAAGIAPAIGTALDAMLGCRSPTVGVLLGEGGSGGALAALAVDRLLVGPDSYFAALVPEGAAVTLRCGPEAAADLQRLRPADLLALGVADEGLEPGGPRAAAQLAAALAGTDPGRREARWSAPVPGHLP
ncbi:MAG: carboxyl transferase domain-containing protein, partial [Mycobacteriales bacterium]